MKLIVTTFILTILTIGVSAQSISKAQAEKDTRALARILFKVHPAPDAYIDADSIRKRLTEMTDFEGDSITRPQWEIRVRHLLISVGCGHTYISGKRRSKSPVPKRFALPFQVFTDRTHAWVIGPVDGVIASPKIVPGSEILALGKRPIGEILAALHKHQSTDGYNKTFGDRLLNKDYWFNNLYSRYFAADSLISVTWKRPAGDTVTEIIKGVDSKELYSGTPKADSLVKVVYQIGKGIQRFYYHPNQPEIGVLDINQFHGNGTRMYRKAMQHLKDSGAKYLVIDLRDNTGGSFGSSINLIRHVADKSFKIRLNRRLFRSWRHQHAINHFNRFNAFLMFDIFNPSLRWVSRGRVYYRVKYKPNKRCHFDGQVFVLTNGLSFSASSQTATFIKATSHAIIIGDETGGGAFANNGMQIPVFKLPGSGTRIKVPQYHLDYQLGADNGRGVMPDIPVSYTVDDVLKRRDLEWAAIFDWIAKHQKR